MSNLPKDCSARVIGSKARQQVHAAFDAEYWEFHEMTGTDHGIDCSLELIEDSKYNNDKIEGQIKGTNSLTILSSNNKISFPLETKTINYGLGCPNAYVLFCADVNNKIVYYLPLQDYFIANPKLFDKLEENQKTINVHIPCDNIVNTNDFELKELAKSRYVEGPSRNLYKYEKKEK